MNLYTNSIPDKPCIHMGSVLALHESMLDSISKSTLDAVEEAIGERPRLENKLVVFGKALTISEIKTAKRILMAQFQVE